MLDFAYHVCHEVGSLVLLAFLTVFDALDSQFHLLDCLVTILVSVITLVNLAPLFYSIARLHLHCAYLQLYIKVFKAYVLTKLILIHLLICVRDITTAIQGQGVCTVLHIVRKERRRAKRKFVVTCDNSKHNIIRN